MNTQPDRRLGIVLVDAHGSARRALAKRLAGHDQLAVAGQTDDPATALALVREHKPQVALIDPGGDAARGRDFVRSLPSLAEDGPLAVVHIAFFDQDLWRHLHAAGAHELILKQLDVDALAARLFSLVLGKLPPARWPPILRS